MPIPTPTPQEAIESLPWVKDGLTIWETKAVTTLNYLASRRSQAFRALIERPDIAQISPDTGHLSSAVGGMIEEIAEMSLVHEADALAMKLMEMPFLDTIEGTDLLPLSAINKLFYEDWVHLGELLASPELSEGISNEAPLTVILSRISRNAPDLAERIAGMSWVEDGISESEGAGAEAIQNIALKSFPVLWALMEKPWVWDGLDPTEALLISILEEITNPRWYSGGHVRQSALEFLHMPFLDTVEAADVMALRALNSIFHDPDGLKNILAHPSLEEGVTDESIPLITAVAALRFGVTLPPLDELLFFEEFMNSDRTLVQERVIALPLSGEVLLVVVHTDEYPYYLDVLENAISKQEEFMGVPYPNSYALLAVADIGGGGYASSVTASNITIDIGYAESGDASVRGVIGHEVGHTYWGGTHPWMTEGGAVFLQRITEGLDTSEFKFRIGEGTCPASDGHRGDQFHNLSELEKEESIRDTHCYYNMGSGVFFDLYHALGDKAFRHGFRALHLNIKADELHDQLSLYQGRKIRKRAWYDGIRYAECNRLLGLGNTLCHMKAAFVAGQEPDIAAKADSILKLWFTAHPDTADS